MTQTLSLAAAACTAAWPSPRHAGLQILAIRLGWDSFRGSELLALLDPFPARSRRELRMSLNSLQQVIGHNHSQGALGAQSRNWPRRKLQDCSNLRAHSIMKVIQTANE